MFAMFVLGALVGYGVSCLLVALAIASTGSILRPVKYTDGFITRDGHNVLVGTSKPLVPNFRPSYGDTYPHE